MSLPIQRLKIIGVEFRIGMQTRRQIEVFLKPLDIVFPWAYAYPYAPECSVTVHTSSGDVTANPELRNVLCANHAPNVSEAEIDAAYAALRAQIEKIER